MMRLFQTTATLTFLVGGLLGCATSPSVDPTDEPLVLHISPDDSMEDVAREIYAAADAEGECTLVWGDVVTQPEEAQEIRVVWAELEHIDGYLLCDEDMELVLLDPRARHMAMLYYKPDGLYVGHPSRGGVNRLEDTPLSIRSDAPAPCLSVFDSDSSEIEAPAYRVLRQLREVPRDFLIAAWPVNPAADESDPATAGDETMAVAKP